jgi:hypothetical protein
VNFIKAFVILLIFINCLLISANENYFNSGSCYSTASGVEQYKIYSYENNLKKKIEAYNDADFNNLMVFYAGKTIKKPPIKTNLKIILTNKKKAAVSVNITGAVFLLAGVSLLSASLAYANYVETNETDYDKYIAGKNLSRGLFYGSMGGFGAGAVGIIVAIPLFVEVKTTKKPVYKKK